MESPPGFQSNLVGKHRLEALTDGSCAIAVPLLVLELKVRLCRTARRISNLLAITRVSWRRTSHLLAHSELQVARLDAPIKTAASPAPPGILVAAMIATLGLASFFPGRNMFAMLPTVLLPRIAKR